MRPLPISRIATSLFESSKTKVVSELIEYILKKTLTENISDLIKVSNYVRSQSININELLDYLRKEILNFKIDSILSLPALKLNSVSYNNNIVNFPLN